LIHTVPIYKYSFFIFVKTSLFCGAFRSFCSSPRLIAEEWEVPVNNFYSTIVDVFPYDLLPYPEGKISAVRSLEITELD